MYQYVKYEFVNKSINLLLSFSKLFFFLPSFMYLPHFVLKRKEKFRKCSNFLSFFFLGYSAFCLVFFADDC